MSKAVKTRNTNDNIYFFDPKTKESKSKFDIISRDFRYILRAPDPKKLSVMQKPLSRGARTLLTNYYDMINKVANKIIFVSHEFISSITEVGNSQNKRYHNELKDLFAIRYHQSVIIDGKKYRDGFAIEPTENTENILKNPKLFYLPQSAGNERLSVPKRTPRSSKKNASLHIEENPSENLKSRSIETEEKIPTPANEKTRSNFEKNISEKDKKVLTLKDYYPLSKDDCYRLQKLSNRSFTQNAMNEILLDMSRRVVAIFHSKKGFFSYFGDCLAKEKRDAVKTDSETFKIKANLTDEDKENRKIYNYLKKVEESLEVSPELHFKKKLACVLADKKAYNLLTSYKTLVIKDHIAKLYLRKVIELTPNELEVILNQIKASHPASFVKKLELITQKPQNKMQNNNLDAVILQKFGAEKGQDIIKNCSIKKLPNGSVQVQNMLGENLDDDDKHLLRTCIKEEYGEEVNIIAAKQDQQAIVPLENDGSYLWKEFEKGMKEQFSLSRKSHAEHMFGTWFYKLKRRQNISANKLVLSGSNFMIDYILSNFESLIDTAVKNKKITIELVYETNDYKPIIFTSNGRKI